MNLEVFMNSELCLPGILVTCSLLSVKPWQASSSVFHVSSVFASRPSRSISSTFFHGLVFPSSSTPVNQYGLYTSAHYKKSWLMTPNEWPHIMALRKPSQNENTKSHALWRFQAGEASFENVVCHGPFISIAAFAFRVLQPRRDGAIIFF